MGIKFELVAKAGEYEKAGEKKVRWHTCGVVMERQDGSMSAKIESLPINFDGWLNLWEPRQKDDKPAPAKVRPAKSAPDSDDIPF